MSDLYSYQCNPFADDSSDNEEDKKIQFNALSSRSSKRKIPRVPKYKVSSKKPKTTHTIDDSDSDDPLSLAVEDDNDELTIGAIAASKADLIIKNTVSGIEPVCDVIHVEASYKDLKSAKDILDRFRNYRTSLDLVDSHDVSIEDLPLSASPSSSSLTASVMASLPSVRSASERVHSVNLRPQYSNTSDSKPQQEEPRIKLKTVLNGSHEWLWKIAVTDSFSKVNCTQPQRRDIPYQ